MSFTIIYYSKSIIYAFQMCQYLYLVKKPQPLSVYACYSLKVLTNLEDMHSIPPLPAGELDASHVTARLAVTGHSLTLCAQQQAHDKGSVRSWGSPPGGRALYLRRLRTLFGTAYTQLENRRRECRTIDTQSIMVVPRYLLSKGCSVRGQLVFCRTGTYTWDAPSSSQTAPHSSIAITPRLHHAPLVLVAMKSNNYKYELTQIRLSFILSKEIVRTRKPIYFHFISILQVSEMNSYNILKDEENRFVHQ